MQNMLPFFFFLLVTAAFFLNLFGLMNLIPIYITLPLLFISIYLMIYSFVHRHVYRGWNR